MIKFTLATALLGAVASVLWLFAQSIVDHCRKLELPPPPSPADPWLAVNETIKHPRQMPDGTWQQAELVWKKCDAPAPSQGDIVVHNREDPAHRAQCAECRVGLKFRGSGVSYRST